MSAQRAGPLEGFAALFALEDLLRRVNRPVLSQADLVTEGFVAEFAGERPLAVVRSSRVYLQHEFSFAITIVNNRLPSRLR